MAYTYLPKTILFFIFLLRFFMNLSLIHFFHLKIFYQRTCVNYARLLRTGTGFHFMLCHHCIFQNLWRAMASFHWILLQGRLSSVLFPDWWIRHWLCNFNVLGFWRRLGLHQLVFIILTFFFLMVHRYQVRVLLTGIHLKCCTLQLI